MAITSIGFHSVVPVSRNETVNVVISPPPVYSRVTVREKAVMFSLSTSTEEMEGAGGTHSRQIKGQCDAVIILSLIHSYSV